MPEAVLDRVGRELGVGRWWIRLSLWGLADEEQTRPAYETVRKVITEFVSDLMLDDLAAAGTPREVAKRVAAKEARLADLGVDELTVQVPGVALPAERTAQVLTGLVTALSR